MVTVNTFQVQTIHLPLINQRLLVEMAQQAHQVQLDSNFFQADLYSYAICLLKVLVTVIIPIIHTVCEANDS